MDRPSAAVIGIGVLLALAVAVLEPVLRIPVLVVLAAGAWFLPRGSIARWGLAAGVPVAIILAWGDVVGGRLLAAGFACADVISPVAWSRVAEAALVIGTIALLARHLGTTLGSLGLRRPSRVEVSLGIVAVALVPIPSIYLGTILAEPFFGPVRLDLAQPLAIIPALALATANGTMEELAYRGALMSWLSRAAGPAVGLIGQAVIFGVAHTGSDFVGPALPVVLVIAAGGLIAGLAVRRTGSLWLPIIVHICFDVPLYYAVACRLS